MKSRSHRLPVSEPHHEDWVDGSWTVDCVCGVNYDDGEEMVGCDECGVWVHTRCFNFVKSEKSFACDKCKSKNSAGGVPDDSEETEVAEFLVELPTKTLRMDNPNPGSVAPRRQFRLWTGLAPEDRGHVQGVPGGEPGLFSSSGMSSIFSPELWKSSGYVPKKFNFRYSEFPHLNHSMAKEKEKELDKTSGEENGNRADSGAGVLFSLLKDSNKTLPTQAVDSGVVRSQVEGVGVHEVGSLRQKKNVVGEGPNFSGLENSLKKDNCSPVHIVLPIGKNKKEKLGVLKEQSAKKVSTGEEYKDSKKRAADSSKAASTSSSDVKRVEFSHDKSSKAVSTQCGPNVLPDQQADHLGECATNLSLKEHGLGVSHRNDATSDEISKESREDRVPLRSEKFTKTNTRVESVSERDGSLRQPVKEESGGGAGNSKISTRYKEPVAVDVKIGSPDAKESRLGHSSDIDDSNSRPNKKFKGDLTADDLQHLQAKNLPPNDVKLNSMKVPTNYLDSSVKTLSEEVRVTDTSLITSEASNQKMPTAMRSPLIGSSRTDKSDESPCNPCQHKQQHTTEGSAGAKKKSSGLKYSSEVADELHKSNGTARSHSAASYQRKGVALVKSTSTSGSNFSKPSEDHVIASTQNPSPVHSRQNGLSDSTVATVKESASANVVAREDKSGGLKKLVKEYSRHSPKIPDTTKRSHMSDSKKPSSDSKGPSIHSSKVPSVTNAANNHVSGECTSLPQVENASNLQNKTLSSAEPGRVEKQSQSSGYQSSSRGNVVPMTASTPANVPSTLSDEELALLLHQELNSSPRVPRVPRMRHAGSLPQLAGPSANSGLMKRTSSGGKDHNVVSRRRTKDFSGDFSHGSVEVDNETKKLNRKPTSPDNRKRDSGYNADAATRREADGRARILQSVKKSSTGSAFSSSSNANRHKLSSGRSSSRTTSDEDPRAVGRQTTRTLPGLIADIMREGKRMTYEELCNAVLPHWPHLRKHNGERYAYSSHSQAVLDCLRNRNEWARLVDRGPKSAPGRKRRKLDGDSLSIESEDNEEKGAKDAKMSGSKSFESPQEEFPKGKRKARKRRRLVPRRRTDVVSDDESEEFSSSSEENSASSEKEEDDDEEEEEGEEEEDDEEEEEEEEVQGGSEASASSDEV